MHPPCHLPSPCQKNKHAQDSDDGNDFKETSAKDFFSKRTRQSSKKSKAKPAVSVAQLHRFDVLGTVATHFGHGLHRSAFTAALPLLLFFLFLTFFLFSFSFSFFFFNTGSARPLSTWTVRRMSRVRAQPLHPSATQGLSRVRPRRLPPKKKSPRFSPLTRVMTMMMMRCATLISTPRCLIGSLCACVCACVCVRVSLSPSLSLCARDSQPVIIVCVC